MKKLLPVKVTLNRTVLRDESGNSTPGARPYNFELSVGRTRLTGVWLRATDENSKKYFDMFVQSLTNRDDIEVEVKG